MIHLSSIIYFGSLLAGSASAFILGVKSRGWIPLRTPSNKIRLENAMTDTEISKHTLERRRNEMELEFDEIKGRREIEVAESEHRQLTKGKNSEIVEQRLQVFLKKQFQDTSSPDNIQELLQIFEDHVVGIKSESEQLKEKYQYLLLAMNRFYRSGNMPQYIKTPYMQLL